MSNDMAYRVEQMITSFKARHRVTVELFYELQIRRIDIEKSLYW